MNWFEVFRMQNKKVSAGLTKEEVTAVGLPLTFRLAEHLALAAAYATSPVMDTLQLYRISVCLPPSSMMSTSCQIIL